MKKSYHSIVAPIEEAIATLVTDCAAYCSAREFSRLVFIQYAPRGNQDNQAPTPRSSARSPSHSMRARKQIVGPAGNATAVRSTRLITFGLLSLKAPDFSPGDV